jgi:glycosyltransferase involved in cell wall biosynthesis
MVHLLMIIPCLLTGGAEWAFIRQANALVGAGHRVTCYLPYRCDSEPAMVAALEKRVSIVSHPLMTRFLHRVLFKLSLIFPKIDPEQRLHSFVLRGLHQGHHFDAVNPHLNTGTTIACQAFRDIAVPITETDHGDYALLLKQDPSLHRLRLPLKRLDAMICPSFVNQERIAKLPWAPSFRSTVIPYSYESPSADIDRALPQDDIFTFGLVSRGVAEKGWREALSAFRLLRQQTSRPVRLLLVGGSDYLDTLARDLESDLRSHVLFAGAQSDPQPWIQCFDVGLLPSYFAAESLPNVIIECLAQGKPVIATDVGGIPEMICADRCPCGLLIPIDPASSHADVPALASAMKQLLGDSVLLQQLRENTAIAIQRYRPEIVASELCQFFQSVRHNKAQHGQSSKLNGSPDIRATELSLPS